ncbi:MAG: 1-acyl-sn-glycerol-3-phosphate acyltransferase [Myxococcales bacterium]|nr:1-acyl-sn-glycerol-3-phosphate acyltransferase [Myxococcales bacterium]
MRVVKSLLRLSVGLVYMAVAVTVFMVVCALVAPWRGLRIRACNVFGHITGRFCLWLASADLHAPGECTARAKRFYPAIYLSNHTSVVDIFIGIWLGPLGVVGVAKKEVVWYPFFGQLYAISGHLLIDRNDRSNAVAALGSLADLIAKHSLSVWMWPEGTRSKDGRLRPFKKGFAHLALATRLPVVPVVVTGAHRAWRKGSLMLEPTHIGIQVLDPIPTTDWSAETLDAHIADVYQRFAAALPDDQRPVPAELATAGAM